MRMLALPLAALLAPFPAAAQHGDHDAHASHHMPGHEAAPEAGEVGNAPVPPVPADHWADRAYPKDEMDMARAIARAEHGGSYHSQIVFNLAEYKIHNGRDGFRWDGEGWFGGDIDRFTLKSEGEGSFGGGSVSAKVQALWSHAIDAYWNLQGGVRVDIQPGPTRTYAALGVEGLAPYWFDVEGGLFLSDRGDLLAQVGAYYDQRITQRLILQPQFELGLAAQNIPSSAIGSGLVDAEFGLRLRYEVRREFAPYVGLSWERKMGRTARFARAAGDEVSERAVVAGIRFWF